MNILRSILLYTLLFLFPALPISVYAAASVPHELGGIKLGADITDYPHLEYANFLKNVVVTDWNGFSKGMISYGICKNPGKIVKIRFKYRDTSKEFYESILQRYKKKFGKPAAWEGDVFGIHHVWKWSFVDQENNRIALVMEHNLKDPKVPIGTVVTFSYPERIDQERNCFDKAHSGHTRNFDHSNCGPNCPLKKKSDSDSFMMPD